MTLPLNQRSHGPAPVLDAPGNATFHYLTAIVGIDLGAVLAANLWQRTKRAVAK